MLADSRIETMSSRLMNAQHHLLVAAGKPQPPKWLWEVTGTTAPAATAAKQSDGPGWTVRFDKDEWFLHSCNKKYNANERTRVRLTNV